MQDLDTLTQAGYQLRKIREEKLLTQLDVQRLTERHFGTENVVLAQQISRIEKGNISKPPIGDLVRLGIVYGLAPNDIAAMYGLWRPTEAEGDSPTVRSLRACLAELGPRERKKLEHWVEFAVMQARVQTQRDGEK